MNGQKQKREEFMHFNYASPFIPTPVSRKKRRSKEKRSSDHSSLARAK
jgi:hypothetical protein